MAVDFLIFVEDPGPAHYIASLPAALVAWGRQTVVLASGLAADVLAKREVGFLTATDDLSAETVIQEMQPRVLLTGTSENPATLGLRLIEAARRAGIKTAAFVDAGVNAPYRFRGMGGDALAFAPDWILVPDNWTRDEFIRIGALADRIIVCGHPQYDYVLDLARTWTESDRETMRKTHLREIAEGRQVVVFLSEGSERVQLLSPVPLEEYILRGRGVRQGRTEIIIEEFLDAVGLLPEKPYLVLRLHPKDQPGDFREYEEEFDHLDCASPPLELVYCADLVVGMTSMLMLEAALLGKRTLSIVPREMEREWLPTIRQGITPCVTNRADLAVTLKSLVEQSGVSEHRSLIAEGALARLLDFMEGVWSHG